MNFQATIKFVIASVRSILGKLGLTDLPGQGRKVTSDKKMIFTSHERYMGGNRDYCSNFSVTFETIGNFLTDFVRQILGKKGVDRVTGPRLEIDARYGFDLKIILKDLG